MDPLYLPSKKSRILCENRVSKINKLYEDVQKRKSKQLPDLKHRDSVVSNNSTSVVTLEPSPTEDISFSHVPNSNNHRSGPYFETGVKPQPIIGIRHNRGLSPSKKYRSALQSPMVSDYDSILDEEDEALDEEDDVNITPKLRSRRSILRLSTESTPFKPSRYEHRTYQDRGDTAQHKERLGVRPIQRKGAKTRIRSQLGQPLPLDYISPSARSYEHFSANSDPAGLEARLRRIMLKDRALFEKKLEQIRRNYSRSPSRDPMAETIHETLEPNSAEPAGDKNEKHTFKPDDLQSELSKTTEKLDEVLLLLRSKQKDIHLELASWTSCIIILFICNVYVYYYL